MPQGFTMPPWMLQYMSPNAPWNLPNPGAPNPTGTPPFQQSWQNISIPGSPNDTMPLPGPDVPPPGFGPPTNESIIPGAPGVDPFTNLLQQYLTNPSGFLAQAGQQSGTTSDTGAVPPISDIFGGQAPSEAAQPYTEPSPIPATDQPAADQPMTYAAPDYLPPQTDTTGQPVQTAPGVEPDVAPAYPVTGPGDLQNLPPIQFASDFPNAPGSGMGPIYANAPPPGAGGPSWLTPIANFIGAIPSFLGNVAGGVSNVASNVAGGVSNIFSDIVNAQAPPIVDMTPAQVAAVNAAPSYYTSPGAFGSSGPGGGPTTSVNVVGGGSFSNQGGTPNLGNMGSLLGLEYLRHLYKFGPMSPGDWAAAQQTSTMGADTSTAAYDQYVQAAQYAINYLRNNPFPGVNAPITGPAQGGRGQGGFLPGGGEQTPHGARTSPV